MFKCLNCGYEINKYEVLYFNGEIVKFCCEKCLKDYKSKRAKPKPL